MQCSLQAGVVAFGQKGTVHYSTLIEVEVKKGAMNWRYRLVGILAT